MGCRRSKTSDPTRDKQKHGSGAGEGMFPGYDFLDRTLEPGPAAAKLWLKRQSVYGCQPMRTTINLTRSLSSGAHQLLPVLSVCGRRQDYPERQQ